MLFSNPSLLALASTVLLSLPSSSSANNLHSSRRERRHRSLSLKQRASTSTGGWSSVGCTQDGPARALTGYSTDLGASATAEAGLAICQKKGFTLASLQYGSQLMCGNAFSNSLGQVLDASQCSSPCSGNPSETCGGSYTSSTYSLSASSSALPTTWASFGCTQDGSSRSLNGYSFEDASKMTVELCLAGCEAKGFSIAALEYSSQCRCGDSFENGMGQLLASSSCSMPCAGNPAELCGGAYIASTYVLLGSASTPATTSVSSSTPSISTPSSAPASDSTSSVPVLASWTYLGCSQDGPARALTGYTTDLGSSATIAACLAVCAGKGLGIAGVQYGSQCYCDSAFRNNLGAIVASDQCSSTCSGDSTTKCGGSYVSSVYTNAALLSASSSSIASTTVSSAAATSSSAVNLPTGWTSLGCTQDGAARALTGSSTDLGSSATVESCLAVCSGQGYVLASLQYGSQCMCGSSFSNSLGTSISPSSCATPCSGNTLQSCGGFYTSNSYRYTLTVSSTASSTVPSASSVAAPAGWTSVGCTQDGSARALVGSSIDLGSSATVESCLALCLKGGFVLAGLQYGTQCMCGSSFSNGLGSSIASTFCATPCTGNSLQTCGGFYTTSTYRYTGSISSSVSSKVSSSASASASAIVLPTGWTTVGCTQDGTARALTGSSGDLGATATVEECLSVCLGQGYVLAGLQYGSQCMCGSSFSNNLGAVISSSSCSMPCTGNAAQSCGGPYVSNAFRYTLALPDSSAVPTASRASSTTSSAAPSPTWISQGCAQDYPYSPMAGRTLTGSYTKDAAMTNQKCWAICAAGGFVLAGTQSTNECWCGNLLDNGNGATAPSSDCQQACVGDSSQMCGGGWRLSIYRSPSFPKWSLKQSSSGSSFFDAWSFYSGVDPTNGFVDYLSKSDAMNAGLAYVNSAGNAIMKVETAQTIDATVGRKSTRISTSNWWFNSGSLVIMDAVHMPIGCGIWPAFWTLGGGAWPSTGEIDILEGVGFYTTNLVSVHTGSGCYIPQISGGTGSLAITNCAAYETGNQGCGIVDNSSNPSYGVPFNNAGGGVYAMSWTDSAISVYFFARGSIPADITNGNPDPDTGNWGRPVARYPGTYCSLSNFFKDHNAIFDITMCGDWAGNNWTTQESSFGQPQSCAALTGFSTCAAYVQARGADFSEAYWEVKSVKLYQK